MWIQNAPSTVKAGKLQCYRNKGLNVTALPDGKGVTAAERGSSSVYSQEVVPEQLSGRLAIQKTSIELDKKLVGTDPGRRRCVHSLPSAMCCAFSQSRDAAGFVNQDALPFCLAQHIVEVCGSVTYRTLCSINIILPSTCIFLYGCFPSPHEEKLE